MSVTLRLLLRNAKNNSHTSVKQNAQKRPKTAAGHSVHKRWLPVRSDTVLVVEHSCHPLSLGNITEDSISKANVPSASVFQRQGLTVSSSVVTSCAELCLKLGSSARAATAYKYSSSELIPAMVAVMAWVYHTCKLVDFSLGTWPLGEYNWEIILIQKVLFILF